MKRKIVLLCILSIFLLPLCLFACKPSEEENLPNYQLNLSYDEETHVLNGSEEITFFNFYNNMFENLYFHLYPNAFREDAVNQVVDSTKIDEAYPNGLSYGNIEVQSVTSDGKALVYVIEGKDENILNVSLPCQLYPDEEITITIDFKVSLANINHRLGYGENTINFGNFYPVLAVYEEGNGFMTEPYHSNGDPFYSECANYNVEIEYANSFSLAHSGSLISSSQSEERITAKIKGDKIRDFAFVLSDKFKKISSQVNGVTVNYFGYGDDTDLEERLQTSVDALSSFNDMFGDYPYSELNIVKSNFVHGGMEYPQLVLISDEVSGEDVNYVIVHEIAHQWWYSVVGNDEYNHAWMDEGLTEYSTFLFFEQNSQYGLNYDDMIEGALNSYKLFERVYKNITGSVDGSMDRPLDKFNTEPEYVQCVYNKSVLMFDTLRDMVGEKKLLKAFKDYYQEYAFKNASVQMLIASFIDSTHYNLEGFFNSWLQGNVEII